MYKLITFDIYSASLDINGSATPIVKEVLGWTEVFILLIAQPVLAHDHVFHTCVLQLGGHFLPGCGVKFRLHTQMDLEPAGIFFPQGTDGVAIGIQLLGVHPHETVVLSGEVLRGVVGETEDIQSSVNGPLHVFFFCAVGMAAPEGMAMVICDHGKHALCKTARRTLRAA